MTRLVFLKSARFEFGELNWFEEFFSGKNVNGQFFQLNSDSIIIPISNISKK